MKLKSQRSAILVFLTISLTVFTTGCLDGMKATQLVDGKSEGSLAFADQQYITELKQMGYTDEQIQLYLQNGATLKQIVESTRIGAINPSLSTQQISAMLQTQNPSDRSPSSNENQNTNETPTKRVDPGVLCSLGQQCNDVDKKIDKGIPNIANASLLSSSTEAVLNEKYSITLSGVSADRYNWLKSETLNGSYSPISDDRSILTFVSLTEADSGFYKVVPCNFNSTHNDYNTDCAQAVGPVEVKVVDRSYSPKVVYGTDNRKDLWEADSSQADLARSVALVIPKQFLSGGGGSIFSFLQSTTLQQQYNLCPDEKFGDQVIAGSGCTGFLIDEQTIATAGHCVHDSSPDFFKDPSYYCNNLKVVFDFNIDSNGGNANTTFASQEVYECKQVLGKVLTGSSSAKSEWALFRLDRPVVGRPALALASRNSVQAGSSLQVIGHPSGLPLKVVDNGQVISVKENGSEGSYILANLDTFGGNSGSPVFNDHNEVVGILVGGAVDYVGSTCKQVNVCEYVDENSDLCGGETVSSISNLDLNLLNTPDELNYRPLDQSNFEVKVNDQLTQNTSIHADESATIALRLKINNYNGPSLEVTWRVLSQLVKSQYENFPDFEAPYTAFNSAKSIDIVRSSSDTNNSDYSIEFTVHPGNYDFMDNTNFINFYVADVCVTGTRQCFRTEPLTITSIPDTKTNVANDPYFYANLKDFANVNNFDNIEKCQEFRQLVDQNMDKILGQEQYYGYFYALQDAFLYTLLRMPTANEYNDFTNKNGQNLSLISNKQLIKDYIKSQETDQFCQSLGLSLDEIVNPDPVVNNPSVNFLMAIPALDSVFDNTVVSLSASYENANSLSAEIVSGGGSLNRLTSYLQTVSYTYIPQGYTGNVVVKFKSCQAGSTNCAEKNIEFNVQQSSTSSDQTGDQTGNGSDTGTDTGGNGDNNDGTVEPTPTPAVINTAHFDGIAANNLTVDLGEVVGVVIEANNAAAARMIIGSSTNIPVIQENNGNWVGTYSAASAGTFTITAQACPDNVSFGNALCDTKNLTLTVNAPPIVDASIVEIVRSKEGPYELNEQIGYTIVTSNTTHVYVYNNTDKRDVSLSTSSNNHRHFSFKGTAYSTIIEFKAYACNDGINYPLYKSRCASTTFTHVMKPTPVVTSGQQLVQNLYTGVFGRQPDTGGLTWWNQEFVDNISDRTSCRDQIKSFLGGASGADLTNLNADPAQTTLNLLNILVLNGGSSTVTKSVAWGQFEDSYITDGWNGVIDRMFTVHQTPTENICKPYY